jgi:hypothetical protein
MAMWNGLRKKSKTKISRYRISRGQMGQRRAVHQSLASVCLGSAGVVVTNVARCVCGDFGDRRAIYVYAEKLGQPNNMFGHNALPGGISVPGSGLGLVIHCTLDAESVKRRERIAPGVGGDDVGVGVDEHFCTARFDTNVCDRLRTALSPACGGEVERGLRAKSSPSLALLRKRGREYSAFVSRPTIKRISIS